MQRNIIIQKPDRCLEQRRGLRCQTRALHGNKTSVWFAKSPKQHWRFRVTDLQNNDTTLERRGKKLCRERGLHGLFLFPTAIVALSPVKQNLYQDMLRWAADRLPVNMYFNWRLEYNSSYFYLYLRCCGLVWSSDSRENLILANARMNASEAFLLPTYKQAKRVMILTELGNSKHVRRLFLQFVFSPRGC